MLFNLEFFYRFIDMPEVLDQIIDVCLVVIGFGLLESGCVSTKNEVNIMMKNVVDIFLGGFTYWLFGFGFQFGYGPFTTPLIGIGSFALDVDRDDSTMGAIYTAFIFQLSFATTATTIVSGAMAERFVGLQYVFILRK